MPTTHYCPTSSWIFQEFLTLLGKMVQSDLVRQIEYLKVAVSEIFATNLAQSSEITVLERDRIKK